MHAASSVIRWLPRQPKADAPASRERFDPADFQPALQTRLLILQATPFCNIDCDYCYLPDRDSTARMSVATARLAARRLREDGLLGDELTVVWHAGEPLAMPVSFYDEAIAAIESEIGAHCELTHSIQTNATLIDDAWCALFKRHRIAVGVSIDGPRALHDAHRRTRAGKGTFDRVARGIALLREHGVPFHAIAVVTDATFTDPDGFCAFFEAQGITELGCNFDEAEGLHLASSLAGRETAHAAFVARLLERALDGGALRVRELQTAFALIAQPLPQYRWRGHAWPANTQAQPFAIVSVAANGDFSSFSPELLGQPSNQYGDFVLGNVAHAGYLAGTASARFQRLWADIARGVAACERSCSHFGFCGGGAPANKFYENGDLASTETLYCRTMVKRPFDAVLARLEQGRAEGMH
ncbi:MAG: cyclophane-forming radical SAM/SPASM peptide maturase GrrM/OscB [Burkholderiales bacterium]